LADEYDLVVLRDVRNLALSANSVSVYYHNRQESWRSLFSFRSEM